MKKNRRLLKPIWIMVFIKIGLSSFSQAPFTAGNIVVCRVGNGSSALSSAAFQAFVDEYTPAGVLVQSIALPTTASGSNQPLVLVGALNAMGMVNLSSDAKYLSVVGFNAATGTASLQLSSSTTFPRTIGLIDYNGNINSSTSLTDFSSGNSPNSAFTSNGTDIWAAGAGATGTTGGVHYATVGSTTSIQLNTAPTGLRVVNIVNNQLYVSTANTSFRLSTVGTGVPTTGGQTVTVLPGIPTSETIHQYAFFDMNSGISGVDVVYVVNESQGIQKYSFDGTTWNLNGTVGLSTDGYRGLTGTISGTTITLFATRKGANSTAFGGDLVTLSDATGYNGAFSGTPAVIASISTANNAAFRGVALVPQPPSPKVALKIFLQGAYNSGLARHKDVTAGWAAILNANALSQPYNTAAFGNYAGTESVASGFFQSTGATTDILDWVLLELRDPTTPSTVIARRAAFVRVDGNVVDLDGTSAVKFSNVASGNYYLVARHRNHLPIRTSVNVSLDGNVYSSTNTTAYDVTTAQSQAYQDGTITANTAMKDLGNGAFAMWAGNANSNTTVRFTGLNNDAGTLLAALGGNQAAVLTSVYNAADINLDGTVRYTGLNNDAGVLLGVLGSNQAAVYTQHQ